MSSQSDFQQSSSSAMESPTRKRQTEKDRSRSRQRARVHKSQSAQQYRQKSIQNIYQGPKKTLIKKPDVRQSLLNFKAFINMQTQKISNQRAQKQYDNYKRQWEEYQNELFIKQHKNDAWFVQKYNPQILDQLQNERKEDSRKTALQFFAIFENGGFDNINLTVQNPYSLGFTANADREDQQLSMVVPINSQSIDISLNNSIDVKKQPYYAYDPDYLTLFIKAVPKTVFRQDIYQVLGNFPGFKHLTLSQPVKKMSFARYCWISFKDQASFKDAQIKMSGLIIKDQPLNVSNSSSKNRRIKILKKYPKSRLETDSKTALQLIKTLDKQCDILGNVLYNANFQTLSKAFDTYLLYLRRVHSYDYFSGTSFVDERNLSLKLGISFLRMEVDYEQLPNLPTIFKKIQEYSQKRIKKQREGDHMTQVRIQIEKMIFQEEKITKDNIPAEMIWKCLFCEKKFKSCQFLAKHIISKHTEIKEKKIQAIMENSYIKDPLKHTQYQMGRDQRLGDMRGRMRGGFRKDRRKEYHDLDEPQGGYKVEKPTTKAMINFLDI